MALGPSYRHPPRPGVLLVYLCRKEGHPSPNVTLRSLGTPQGPRGFPGQVCSPSLTACPPSLRSPRLALDAREFTCRHASPASTGPTSSPWDPGTGAGTH